MGGFLDEALAEPTPSAQDTYDVLPPVTPAPAPRPMTRTYRPVDPSEADTFRESRSGATGNTALGGIALMALAALWFFGGLAVGYIFFYPPILFLIGLVTFLKGVFGAIVGQD